MVKNELHILNPLTLGGVKVAVKLCEEDFSEESYAVSLLPSLREQGWGVLSPSQVKRKPFQWDHLETLICNSSR